MYMMKAHELMGVKGSRAWGHFLFLSPVHIPQIQKGDHMTAHADFMHSVPVSMWMLGRGSKPILSALWKVSLPFKKT